MKRRLLIFYFERKGDRPYLLRRGEYVGCPCVMWREGLTAVQAATEAAKRIIYLAKFPTPVFVAERYVDEQGQIREFEFNGEPVIAEFMKTSDFINFLGDREDGSCHFDLSREHPDIFVLAFEGKIKVIPLEVPCAA